MLHNKVLFLLNRYVISLIFSYDKVSVVKKYDELCRIIFYLTSFTEIMKEEFRWYSPIKQKNM